MITYQPIRPGFVLAADEVPSEKRHSRWAAPLAVGGLLTLMMVAAVVRVRLS